jgi:hypothetical protein
MILPARDGRVALSRTFTRHRFSLSATVRLNATGVLPCTPADAMETPSSLRQRRQWVK